MITRRDVLKLGLLGGGATLLARNQFTSRVAASSGNLPPSPATRPFVMELPKPPSPNPVPRFAANAPESRRFADGARYFELVVEERFVQVHPDLPPTPVWGYRDINDLRPHYPFVAGPTFKETYGKPVIIRMHNRLPANHTGFGRNRTTIHFHGGHTPFRSDGFPLGINPPNQFKLPPGVPFGDFGVGESFDYCFPLQDPGFSTGMGDPAERASTMWYHDHLLDFTGPNVYRGLSGFFLAFDELDANDETKGLRLPSGEFDVPLVIQDRILAADGTLVFNPLNHDGFLGDKMLVNGAIQPYLRVKRRKYRFRILNGSNARFFQVFLSNAEGRTFPVTQISTEAGLLSRPVRDLDSAFISPSWRVELVIDFSQFREGDELFLENRLEQVDGRGPKRLGRRVPLVKFIVEEAVPDPSAVPDRLRPLPPISERELSRAAANTSTFEFDRRHGAWAINGQLVDPERPLIRVPLDTPLIWRFVNKSGGWFHPIHVHHEFMRVIRRNGQLPPLLERDGVAKKDAPLLGPNDVVDVFIKFRDFVGPFVFHCHNTEHEDMAMMARFDVV